MACNPTGVLRDEHETILRVLGALEALLDRGGDGTAEVFGDCVDFFRLYADAAHHGKEEDHLFDALEDHGLARDMGPVAAMLEEHRRGREYVREMARSVRQLEDPGPRHRFESVARDYIQLLREHIMKENPSVFDVADRVLDEPACRALCEGYDLACARSFEGRTLAELERLADRIIERAAP